MFSHFQRSYLTLLTGSATALSLFMSNAFAFDPDQLIASYKNTLIQQGIILSYENFEKSGDDSLSLTNAELIFTSGEPVATPIMTFSGIKEQETGGFTVDQINTGALTAHTKELDISFTSALLKNITLNAPNETSPLKKLQGYEIFELGAGEIKRGDTRIASMSGARIDLSPITDKVPITFKAHVADIMVDTSLIPNPEYHQTLDEMGYDKAFSGHISMVGTWNLADGRMEISNYDIAIDKVGTLSISFALQDYTLDVIARQQEFQKQIAESGLMDKEKKAAAEEAMLLTYKDLKLEKLELSFKDDSLTSRAIDVAAKRYGQPREQLIAGAPIFVSIGLAQLQMPEFTEMVANAVRVFLKTPGTFTLSAKPEKPVSMMQINAAIEQNVKSLIPLLNVRLEAK